MKRLQNGRSMIEMLGVLAIIGVLSIGGLAGYTMAMNRYRANAVLDYVARCAVIAQTRGTGIEAFEATTCDVLMGDENAPQGDASGYAVSAFTANPAADATFTITTPKLNSDIAAAVAGRSSSNPSIANAEGVVTFTFKR